MEIVTFVKTSYTGIKPIYEKYMKGNGQYEYFNHKNYFA